MHFDQSGVRSWANGTCKLVQERLFRFECARMHKVGENDDNEPEDLVVEPFANLTLLHAFPLHCSLLFESDFPHNHTKHR